ncbi:hypothetical protein BGLA2_260081 [Burkholderia gladioli]|nr:hypothetical protein BGLA2_260081 [Burkholderia gladioli]
MRIPASIQDSLLKVQSSGKFHPT